MKKFVYLISKIILFVISFYLLIIIFFKISFQSELKEFNNIKDKSLIMGDSHTETSIKSSIDRKYLNLSRSAESFMFTYKKIQKLDPKNIKEIFIGIDFQNFYQDNTCTRLNNKKNFLNNAKLYFPILNYNEYFRRDLKSSFEAIIKIPEYFFRIYFSKYTKNKRYFLGSNYLKLTDNKLDKSLEHLRNEEINKTICIIEIQYLDSIAKYCYNNNIKLSAITTPIHKQYFYKNEILIQKTDSIILSKKLNHLNFRNINIPDNYFYDYSHLNSKGANYFTNLFYEN